MPLTIPYTTWRWQLRPTNGPGWAEPAPRWVQKNTTVRTIDPEREQAFNQIVQKRSAVRERGL